MNIFIETARYKFQFIITIIIIIIIIIIVIIIIIKLLFIGEIANQNLTPSQTPFAFKVFV